VKVNNLTIFKINGTNNEANTQTRLFGVSCPNLAPLKQDTVSFKGAVLKKSDFKGVDLAVIEKFKPNIQQFKKKEDLQTFAENKIRSVMLNSFQHRHDEPALKDINSDDLKDFGGRQEETKIQRKAMLKEWFDYVIKENDAYSNTQRLVILSAITKDLKPNNDNIPEVLNKGVLAQTITELEEKLKTNPKEKFDFNKMYQNNLRTSFMKDSSTGETMTGWIIIPSKENDPENFEKNVEKLKTLSHNSWCTKSFNAKPYLSAGDFHVYLENGQPKLGVRFIGDAVQEIQGEENNGKIPLKYLEVFKNHQTQSQLSLSNSAKKQLERAEVVKVEVERIKQKLGSVIELNTIDDAIKIFDYLGITSKQKNGKLVISHYAHCSDQYNMEDIGINENKLLDYVSEIKDYAQFASCSANKLTSIKSIGGYADFRHSNITDLGNLETIGDCAYFDYSKVINLGKLKRIGGYTSFKNSKITDLGMLQAIGNSADFSHSQITSLGNLQSIGGNTDFTKTQITDLGHLESIGGNADFNNSIITSLGNLKKIGGNANLSSHVLTDIGLLEIIGGAANFSLSKITSLKNLRYIGGTAEFTSSEVSNLGKLKKVRRNVIIKDSKLHVNDFSNVNVRGEIISDEDSCKNETIWEKTIDKIKKMFK